jgi:hypothetical protein
MRSIRVLAIAALAVFGLVAYAAAQSSSTTVFTVGGTVTVHGGTKAKPKPGGLSFRFDVSDPSGNQTPPVQTYSIMYEGGRLNTTLIPGCKADAINTPVTPTTDVCPKGSKIGSGKLNALIGSAGQPVATASACAVTSGDMAGLKVTVPEMLRHQVGLDITVTHAEATLNAIVVKKRGRKVGYIESTGCKDATRDLVVTFTDETGASFPAKASVGKC